MPGGWLRVANDVTPKLIQWWLRFKTNYVRESTDLRVNLAWHDQNRFKREFVLFWIFSLRSNLHTQLLQTDHTHSCGHTMPAQQTVAPKLSPITRQGRQTSQTTHAKSAARISMARVVWRTRLAKARCTASATHV